MVYLDYSATTPVNEEVLESFNKVCRDYPGNANSLHKLGVSSKKLMDAATNNIAKILKVKDDEVIFTSGASESNNLAIMGVVNNTSGKTIITTKLEHSSILSTVNYLKQKGYNIKYVKIKEDGLVDLEDLEKLIDKDTILVSIAEVNSEIGIVQNVNEIGKLLKKYDRVLFHVDGTQAVGKKKVNLENIDLYSFSAHKIYGLKGVGVLIKKENISLVPIIHGGKSQTVYRSGTPALPLMVATSKALTLMYEDFDKKLEHVKKVHDLLIKGLKKIDGVTINSNNNCLKHIVNISIKGIKPETLLHALEEDEIYISTKTACSSDEAVSLAVYTLTHDIDLSSTSIRISLSHLTTEKEITFFLEKLSEKIKKLQSIGN